MLKYYFALELEQEFTEFKIKGVWQITEAWIGLNDNVSHICLAGALVASWWQRGGWVAGSNPFTVMTNIFVTEFSKFSENI